MSIDFTEVHKLVGDLGAATEEVHKRVPVAVGVAAEKGKRVWKESVSSPRGHLKAYPHAIHYDDVDVIFGQYYYTDLGPDLSRAQGGLGIVEDSPGGVRGAPQKNYEQAAKVIEDDLEKGLDIALAQSLAAITGG